MRNGRLVLAAALTIALSTAFFYFVEHQISATLLEASLRPEVRSALDQSMNDQKELRRLDPQHASAYRQRFDSMHRIAARIDVLRLSRAELLRRYELVLAAVFAAALVLAASFDWTRRRRDAQRLAAIQSGLEALSRGESRIELGDRRRDLLGRIGRMIEDTARVVSGQRRRIESLQHLSSWQEAARRHAHEIRTPVTAARLEIERLATLSGSNANHAEIESAKESALEELDRLGRYTAEFSSFAKLPQPVLRVERIGTLVYEFCRAFAAAWPNLLLRCPADSAGDGLVLADGDMLRQVFVNLCTNASHAVGAHGTVTFTIARENGRVLVDVKDDGRGIDPAVRARLFEPYATTRRIGQGMGLGLAISRKIMLDHEGDLELAATSASGTTFRLSLPAAEERT